LPAPCFLWQVSLRNTHNQLVIFQMPFNGLA